jgi:uncharacterized membrane protein
MRDALRYGAAWLAGAAVFLAMDMVWLTLAFGRLYKPELGDLLLAKPRMAPAIAFYLIYLTGMIAFCAVPAAREGRWLAGLLRGAAFGIVCYATYDLTNQATLAVWSVRVTVLDLAWGATVTAVSAAASAAVLMRLR